MYVCILVQKRYSKIFDEVEIAVVPSPKKDLTAITTATRVGKASRDRPSLPRNPWVKVEIKMSHICRY